MKGSLPPISRLIRATRSAQTAAIFLPVSTEPVKATQATRSSATIAAPTSPAPATRLTTPAGKWSKHGGERERGERGDLGRLADGRVAGRERRGELPGQQQQRVVPGDDAGGDADRLLDDERQLGRLDRRDHPAGRVAADLGVVVEGGRGPVDLVGVLDHRLAALAGHQAPRARPSASRRRLATSWSISPRSTAGVAPRRAGPPGPRRSRRRRRLAKRPAPWRRSPRSPGSRLPGRRRSRAPGPLRSAAESPPPPCVDASDARSCETSAHGRGLASRSGAWRGGPRPGARRQAALARPRRRGARAPGRTGDRHPRRVEDVPLRRLPGGGRGGASA